MGFCLLNNIAVTAAALAERGERVVIVDWDVHHGNGTQDIFWDDPRVLYISTHGVEIRYGPPVQVLLQTAEDENADLIVVGTRGASGAMHIRLGSTSSQLTEQSTRPVAVIAMPAGSR
jgi:nucleotide-binding universal stress UspA family protein